LLFALIEPEFHWPEIRLGGINMAFKWLAKKKVIITALCQATSSGRTNAKILVSKTDSFQIISIKFVFSCVAIWIADLPEHVDKTVPFPISFKLEKNLFFSLSNNRGYDFQPVLIIRSQVFDNILFILSDLKKTPAVTLANKMVTLPSQQKITIKIKVALNLDSVFNIQLLSD